MASLRRRDAPGHGLHRSLRLDQYDNLIAGLELANCTAALPGCLFHWSTSMTGKVTKVWWNVQLFDFFLREEVLLVDPWSNLVTDKRIGVFGPNPVIDCLRTLLPRSEFVGPPPQMFATGPWPPLLASGADPSILRLVHWRLAGARDAGVGKEAASCCAFRWTCPTAQPRPDLRGRRGPE